MVRPSTLLSVNPAAEREREREQFPAGEKRVILKEGNTFLGSGGADPPPSPLAADGPERAFRMLGLDLGLSPTPTFFSVHDQQEGRKLKPERPSHLRLFAQKGRASLGSPIKPKRRY